MCSITPRYWYLYLCIYRDISITSINFKKGGIFLYPARLILFSSEMFIVQHFKYFDTAVKDQVYSLVIYSSDSVQAL